MKREFSRLIEKEKTNMTDKLITSCYSLFTFEYDKVKTGFENWLLIDISQNSLVSLW